MTPEALNKMYPQLPVRTIQKEAGTLAIVAAVCLVVATVFM